MILNESKRDELLMPYVQLMAEKGIDISLGKLKTELLELLVKKAGLRNLSLGSNYYLAGAAKYYFNGELTTNGKVGMLEGTDDIFNKTKCKYLNEIILILRNAYIDSVGTKFELEEDFGKLSLDKLIKKYNKKIKAALGAIDGDEDEEEEKPIDYSVGNKGYTFDVLYSYDDARKYFEATSPGAWCITYGKQHYDAYIRNLNIHYVIFRQNGYENVPRRKGENWSPNKPQDEYGNSLIALLQSNVDGEPVYITSRWNHGDYDDGSRCEADHAYTKEEFLNVVGMSDADLQRIFQIWKQHKSKAKDREASRAIVRDLKYKQMRIDGGEAIEKILGELRPQDLIYGNGTWAKSVGVYRVGEEENEKYVLVDRGNILFETMVSSKTHYVRSKPIITPQLKDAMANNPSLKERMDSWRGLNTPVLKNAVSILTDDNMRMIYNIRLHQFVNVDGVIKFKYISSLTNGSDAIFYEVAMGKKQRAFIFTNTNQPLKLPNGSCWFEDYKKNYRADRRSIELENIFPSLHYLRLIYDSSAGKEYDYSITDGKFFSPADAIAQVTGDDRNTVAAFLKSPWRSTAETPEGYGIFTTTVNANHIGYFLFKGSEIVGFNQCYDFSNIDFCGKQLIHIVQSVSDNIPKDFIYNTENGEFLKTADGKIVVARDMMAIGQRNNKLYRIKCGAGSTYSPTLLYSPKYNAFLKYPTDGRYDSFQNSVDASSNNDYVYLLLNDELNSYIGIANLKKYYLTQRGWNYAAKDNLCVKVKTEDLINGHITTAKELENAPNTVSESIKLDVGDIKMMVTEAIRKILKGN